MIETYKPKPEDLWFREQLLADPETMAYNAAWGGTIRFPREEWEDWYRYWLEAPESRRYYRYLRDAERRVFVGEIAYHSDERRGIHLCDVIVSAQYRRRGYGTAGIRLLCRAAGENGISALYDELAADNPSLALFLKNGFAIESRRGGAVTVKRVL